MIKLLDILENKILVPLRVGERAKNYQIILQKKIQQYIKDGGKGDLDLYGAPITSLPSDLSVGGGLNLEGSEITSLPSGLTVGGNLNLYNTPLSKSHTRAQIRQMAPGIKGYIYI